MLCYVKSFHLDIFKKYVENSENSEIMSDSILSSKYKANFVDIFVSLTNKNSNVYVCEW